MKKSVNRRLEDLEKEMLSMMFFLNNQLIGDFIPRYNQFVKIVSEKLNIEPEEKK